MSITINQQPPEITPVYNDMVYHVSSTNTGQQNFKFIADVYVNGTKVDRLKRSPDPDFSVGVFDVHKIIEPYVNYDVDLTSTDAFYKNSNSYAKVQIVFGEEYGSLTTGVTTYANLTSGNNIFAYPGSFKSFDYIDYNYLNNIVSGINSDFMTNAPRTFNLREDQDMFLSFYVNTTNTAYKASITTYTGANATGSAIQTVEIDNRFTTISADDRRFLRVACGYNLNDIDEGTYFTAGAQPVITASVKSYTFLLKDFGGNGTTESFTFNILDDCHYFDVWELHFQNVFGFFDSFQFTRKNTKNTNIERKEYKKNVGTLSSTAYTLSKKDRGYLSFFTASDEVVTLNSAWITEEEYAWLTELIESPQVFVNNAGTLEAVTIIDTAYETKQVNNQNLISVVLNVKYSQRNYRQRY